jgi:murein hydrolase activator
MRRDKSILAIIFLLFISCIFFAQVAAVQKKQSQLKKLETEVNNLKSMIVSTEEGQKASLDKYQALNQLVALRKRYISELQSEVGKLESSMSDSEELINALSRDLDSLKSDYAEMIYSTSKMTHSSDRLFLIFSARNYNQLAMRLKFLNQFSKIKKEQVEKILLVKATLQTEKEIVSNKYDEKKNALSKIVNEKKKLSNEMLEVNTQYTLLQSKEKQLSSQLKTKEKEIKLIKAAIEEMLKKPEINIVALSKNFASNKGKLPWPVKSNKYVSWKYGVQPHPTIRNVEINNLGMGIQTSPGASVYAAFEGEVRKVLSIPGSGQTIMIKHGEYFSVYGRIENVEVAPGTKVLTGQKLGTVMEVNENNSIDFQIWHKQENQNPESWLTK